MNGISIDTGGVSGRRCASALARRSWECVCPYLVDFTGGSLWQTQADAIFPILIPWWPKRGFCQWRTNIRFVNPKITNDRGRELTAEIGSPVWGERLPAWLKRRITVEARRRIPGILVSQYGRYDLLRLVGASDRWLDHWGTTRTWGREIFVSEPYGLTADAVEELLEFCRVLNLGFDFDATSSHFPTRTLRIMMWPREWGSPPKWEKPEGAA